MSNQKIWHKILFLVKNGWVFGQRVENRKLWWSWLVKISNDKINCLSGYDIVAMSHIGSKEAYRSCVTTFSIDILDWRPKGGWLPPSSSLLNINQMSMDSFFYYSTTTITPFLFYPFFIFYFFKKKLDFCCLIWGFAMVNL